MKVDLQKFTGVLLRYGNRCEPLRKCDVTMNEPGLYTVMGETVEGDSLIACGDIEEHVGFDGVLQVHLLPGWRFMYAGGALARADADDARVADDDVCLNNANWAIPPIVKVGPVTYTVTEHDWPPDKEEGSQAMGRHIESTGQIMLLRSMPVDVKRVSLWHEIIHAIIDHAGHEHNEAWIDAVAYGIVDVLNDNGVL